jgi:hypothetical protein
MLRRFAAGRNLRFPVQARVGRQQTVTWDVRRQDVAPQEFESVCATRTVISLDIKVESV